MRKLFTIILFSIFVTQFARGQKQDTLIYYLKDNGQLVTTKDSSDYYRVIMPAGKSNKKLYPVKDYYKNGVLKMEAFSISKALDIQLNGQSINYYSNGKTKSIKNTDKTTFYYPNGQVYCTKEYTDKNAWKLVTCYDSTGKILAKNGKGLWIEYDTDSKAVIGEGSIQGGAETGEWHGTLGDSVKYTCTYDEGKIMSGISYDKQGRDYTFTEIYRAPVINGLPFNQFIWKGLKYPAYARENNIQGKVIISFVIEQDSTLSHVKILRQADKILGDEVLRLFGTIVSYTSPQHYGIPVSSSVSHPMVAPVNFRIDSDN